MIRTLVQRYVVRRKTFDNQKRELEQLRSLTREQGNFRGEYLQDLWVLNRMKHKGKGYFVEFGAANGETISNTYLLEKDHGWTGILAEPCRSFHKDLVVARKCIIETRMVWSGTGTIVTFVEYADGFLSRASSENGVAKEAFKEYPVETVSLNDLLRQHSAPKQIDFLSIDVEGNEFGILEKFFTENEYEIFLICVEHNWSDRSSKIRNLLESHGYSQEYPELSHRDYWMVRLDLA